MTFPHGLITIADMENMGKKRDESVRRLTAFVPAVLLMALIFFFSAQPSEESSVTSEFIGVKLFTEANFLFGFGWDLDKIYLMSEDAQHAIRKAAHFTEYLVLGIALIHGFRINFPAGTMRARQAYGRWGLCSLLFGSLYAASDEIHQCFIPGRYGAAGDAMIDCAGVLTGILLALCAVAWREKRRQRKAMRRNGTAVYPGTEPDAALGSNAGIVEVR